LPSSGREGRATSDDGILDLALAARKEGIDASNAPVTAQRLVEAAHEVCPYSRATRGNVPVTVKGVAV